MDVRQRLQKASETVRVSFTEYRGNELLDIRAYYPISDDMKAGKGISLQRSQIATLRKALQQAERAVKGERGRAGGGSLGAAARVGPVHIAEAIPRLQILQFSRMRCFG